MIHQDLAAIGTVSESQHAGHLVSSHEQGGVWVACSRCGRQWGIRGGYANRVTNGTRSCDSD
jgi:hypothetical protein